MNTERDKYDAAYSAGRKSVQLNIQFECGQENRFSELMGPYDFIQATYGDIRCSPDGDVIAYHKDGWWFTINGERWSDFIISIPAA